MGGHLYCFGVLWVLSGLADIAEDRPQETVQHCSIGRVPSSSNMEDVE